MAAGAEARTYYLVPRRSCQAVLALLLLVFVGVPFLVFVTAPRWLPAWPAYLDEDRPLANPDVVVLKSAGESEEAVREAARLHRGGVEQVALLGRPFTPDDLAPPARSPHVATLLSAGVSRAAIVEIYRGESVYEEMIALREVAAERGWRRILFFVDELGGRRNLVAADRIVGIGGRVALGQRTFRLGWFDASRWWQGGLPRTIVFVRTVQVAFTMVSNRR